MSAIEPPEEVEVEGVDSLIERMEEAETIEDWSFIVGDYVHYENAKMGKEIAAFNLGTATDCVNRGTDRCQVGETECYAYKSETRFPHVKEKRERQEYLWDSLDPETFAKAYLCHYERRDNPVIAFRFDVSGDFRVPGDVVRANEIARRLQNHGILVYTYTSSSFLDWSKADHLTVNASNDGVEHSDQRFIVVEEEDEIPDHGFRCHGDCSECFACMHPGGDANIYEVLH